MPVGTHYILELHGCSCDVLNDPHFVTDAVKQASHHAGATLLNLSHHKFEPHGVTAVGLLAESHLSIHTWPEHGYAAVDVFTCGETTDPRKACEYLVKRFAAREHRLLVVPRGGDAHFDSATEPETLCDEVDLCQARN
jgi:S-adenosylmethionine decarboxylase